MEMEQLIKPIVTQILSMMNKRVLLFISGGAVNVKDIFNTLSSYKIVHYDIVHTDNSNKVISDEYIKNLNANLIDCKDKMVKAIKEADVILVPVMTRNTLSKCALGISDNLVTLGIAESLMMNKEIIAVKDSFDPSNNVNISLGYSKNPVYNNFISDYEKRLVSFGIKFIDSEELDEILQQKLNLNLNLKINKCDKKNCEVEPNNFQKEEKKELNFNVENEKNRKVLSGVLTLEDIMVEVDGDKEIHVKQGALITSLAKDYIYNNNIEVKYY
jgi:ethanolamine utilization protein